jgi:hypothetical protein
MITLIVKGDNIEQEDELTTKFYVQLEDIFNMFSAVQDSNVVRLEYVGPDSSSLIASNEFIDEGEVGDNNTNFFAIITIAATVVTLVSLVVGLLWKTKQKEDKDDYTRYGKPMVDDKSLAVETAALTMTTSVSADESSDVSSCFDHDVKEFYKKQFVLAEEEESHWKRLGILPKQLEEIREEFSQCGSDFVDEKSM